MSDAEHMRAAVALARRGSGQTWPNPSVGCVIVRDGRVAGRGTTAPGGRPHAEAVALAMAGDSACGATAYVTLEPCSHHGRAGPCADALVAAGVARVVIACGDPDPRVNGSGIARLQAAGVTVEFGSHAAEARDSLAGFLTRVLQGRPLVMLKLATTLDGRIATAAGESRWITGVTARRATHAMRARHDAVMVGVGTVLADDPDLTCRVAGLESVPGVRVVADSHLRTSPVARLVATARTTPTWVLHRRDADVARADTLRRLGIRLIPVPEGPNGLDLHAALQALGDAGLTSLLVEGGAGIAAGLLQAGLVDRVAWFHAPAVMGGDGWPAAQVLGIAGLNAIPRFVRTATHTMGDDMLTELSRAA